MWNQIYEKSFINDCLMLYLSSIYVGSDKIALVNVILGYEQNFIKFYNLLIILNETLGSI